MSNWWNRYAKMAAKCTFLVPCMFRDNNCKSRAAILRYPLPDLDELEELAQEQQQNEAADDEQEVDNEKHDPEKRIREDLQDMGL